MPLVFSRGPSLCPEEIKLPLQGSVCKPVVTQGEVEWPEANGNRSQSSHLEVVKSSAGYSQYWRNWIQLPPRLGFDVKGLSSKFDRPSWKFPQRCSSLFENCMTFEF